MLKLLKALVFCGFLLWLSCPFWLSSSASFEGTDGLAVEAIQHSRPGYKPWFRPLWNGGSAEIQSGLFALQAATGAGVLGYILGYYRARFLDRA